MKDSKENGSFVQCQHCGNIFYINQKIPVDVLYINHICDKCGEQIMLNCGDKLEDVYNFINIDLDNRYYSY